VFSPFGKLLLQTGTLNDNAFGLAAQRMESSGLYHMGARRMNPSIGIFVMPDPSNAPDALRPQTLNRFAYAGNSPVNLIDPTGYAEEEPGLFDKIALDISRSELAQTISNFFVNTLTGADTQSENNEVREQSQYMESMVTVEVRAEIRTAPAQAREVGGHLLTALSFSPIAEVALPLKGARGASTAWSEYRSASEAGGLAARGLRPAPGTRAIPNGIPEGWRIRPTQGEGGAWFYDPSNKGNAVRVMPGTKTSPFVNSQSPYVRWQRNGQALDAGGSIVSKNTPNAHIPLNDFRFNPELYK
jgi:RHS repeat-associated protein